jgi:type II secretory ATPase GspE/PulE/Tfp pilus assembly ATPase PilB-like protein
MPDETRVSAAPERTPERDARALREAASGALALRFPARWLEEHAVLPLSITDGVAHVAAEGAITPVVGDVLTRTLQAPLSVRAYPAAEIRAALVATPRAPAAGSRNGHAHALQGDFTESLDDLRALASREPVIQVVNALLAEAARSGASDVHFESTAMAFACACDVTASCRMCSGLGRHFKPVSFRD